jgi:hypothetical protein
MSDLGNLRPAGRMRPSDVFDAAREQIWKIHSKINS